MIKLLLAIITVAVILLLVAVTLAGVLEAKTMKWETRTIIREEKENEQ